MPYVFLLQASALKEVLLVSQHTKVRPDMLWSVYHFTLSSYLKFKLHLNVSVYPFICY